MKDDINHPQFQDCGPTVNFIKQIDTLFDILNSRLPWAKGLKGPLNIGNERKWRSVLTNTVKYITNLKTSDSKLLWQTQRKTAFLGFAISISSIQGIFDDFIKTDKLKYFLTYKVSQDHLELFFCSIR